MIRLALPLLLTGLLTNSVLAQQIQPAESGRRETASRIGRPDVVRSADNFASYRSPKKPGHYSALDWRHLIDSLWGPGLPTPKKLEIFDAFWGGVDREYAGFPNLSVNWDSLRAHYRPEVEAGVSRGRFAAIMSQLSVALLEAHTGIEEAGIDTVNGISVHDTYLPGVPLFWPTGWDRAGNFGAALTPLPDSSLLVYRGVPSHPLGLVPGDIVLGYDRIPWKRLSREILAAELPMQALVCDIRSKGSTSRSWTHGLLNSAGANWGLFDTIDVVKYASGDTLHLSTAPLAGQDWRSLYATDQIPVPGVSMPDVNKGEVIAEGVIANTSVGYIYINNWQDYVGPYFALALKDLLTARKVSGLIIDSRFNCGGFLVFGSSYLDPLFNFNPVGATRWREARRLDPADRLSFSYHLPWDSAQTVQPDYCDRPIAFLTGPYTWSAGDLTTFKMRFHPMSRLFGLPTSGTFPGGETPAWEPDEWHQWGTWTYMYEITQMQSLVKDEGLLMHKGFPVDEEVWLTREGAAKGEDDVVKRALAWISGLSYSHDVAVSRSAVRKTGDTIIVTACVANPLNHELSVSAIIADADGATADSVLLRNDGLHGDGAAGDSLWGATVKTPASEGFFGIDVRTDDRTQGTFRRLPDARTVTSAGPIAVAGYSVVSSDTIAAPGKTLSYQITMKNLGSAVLVPEVTAKVRSLDTTAILNNVMLAYGDLAPGQSSSGTIVQKVRYASSRPGNYSVDFAVDISTKGMLVWTDTFTDIVTGVSGGEEPLPTAYRLDQNYPNPFNPTTTVRYEVPTAGRVKLAVCDILGRELAVLVSEKKPVGRYEVTFDASGLASGMYLCKMTAGSFAQTRKMLFMK